MTARTGLADLIEIVRGYTEAGSADYTLGTASYWDGDQVQRVLDRNRLDVYREQLTKVINHLAGGSIEYRDYYSQYGNFEKTTGGTAIFFLEDSTGTDASTAIYSVDYERGHVTFTQDTAGTTYYLTGRSYDLYGAAAEIWQHKLSHQAGAGQSFDWSTDNMSMKRSQSKEHFVERANYFAGLARPKVVTMYRSDNT